MTSPSLVILTEPANCALADGQLLLQAVLEAQELSREGVPVSNAFCDNPAAAESFIEAYASAFAGLQLESPNLPLPEQLYAMMVDGRLAALPDLHPVPDGAMQNSAGELQPLVVLSMGPPDALMQALQGNGLAKRNIKLVEVAPLEQAGSASVPVAAAVAAHALAGTSWSPEAALSSHSRDDEEGGLASSEGSAYAPLKLDDQEFNLNYIETGDERDQVRGSQSVTAIVNAAADVSGAAGLSATTGAARPVHADLPAAEDGNPGSPPSQPDPGSEPGTRTTAAPAPTPVHPAAPELTTAPPEVAPEPVVAAIPTPNPVEKANAEEGTPSSPPVVADPAVIEAPSSAGAAEVPRPGPIGGDAGDSLPDAEQVSDGPGESAAPSAPGAIEADTTEPGHDLADDRPSFSDPGEDVTYPPTGSFTSDDDVPYPLPLAAAPEADDLGGMLRMSLADEIVDFEAILSSADHVNLTAEPFDPVLMRAGRPDGLDQHGFDGPPQHADPGHVEKPTPHRDTHHDETVTPVHDLDL